MDTASISALAALAGATIGGLTSFATSWLTQRTQLRHMHREAETSELRTLYQAFITEATRLTVEAHRAKTDDMDDLSGLLGLHGLIGRMRLISSPPVIEAAMAVEGMIIDVYLGPDRSVREVIEIAREHGRAGTLVAFSEACRNDLIERGTLIR